MRSVKDDATRLTYYTVSARQAIFEAIGKNLNLSRDAA